MSDYCARRSLLRLAGRLDVTAGSINGLLQWRQRTMSERVARWQERQ
ncbi:MAG TPA: hypothetical protein VLW25_06735 [Bryobacteraceae bacterium]|nr:hypothetical protein [Bryobacteraceae bacterium]